MDKVQKRLIYLRQKLEKTVDNCDIKPNIKVTIEKINKDAIFSFKNSQVHNVRESWQFSTQLPDDFSSDEELNSQRSSTHKIVIKSQKEINNQRSLKLFLKMNPGLKSHLNKYNKQEVHSLIEETNKRAEKIHTLQSST